MKGFIEYLSEQEMLQEKALNIGNRSVSYPKFGNILISAGGAGSGKSFSLNRFMTFEGKRFDLDDIKTRILKFRPKEIEKKFVEETGRYLDSIDLGVPEDVSLLHTFTTDHNLDDKMMTAFFIAQRGTRNKANVIMDVTLKNTEKLKTISAFAELGGYDKKKIHIVWFVNDFNVATIQNQQRERTVSAEIMLVTHRGAAMSMKRLVKETNEFREYADGDIWIFFNRAEVDNSLIRGQSSFVVDKYTAIRIKEAGKPADYDAIEKEVIEKINSYVPSDGRW